MSYVVGLWLLTHWLRLNKSYKTATNRMHLTIVSRVAQNKSTHLDTQNRRLGFLLQNKLHWHISFICKIPYNFTTSTFCTTNAISSIANCGRWHAEDMLEQNWVLSLGQLRLDVTKSLLCGHWLHYFKTVCDSSWGWIKNLNCK